MEPIKYKHKKKVWPHQILVIPGSTKLNFWLIQTMWGNIHHDFLHEWMPTNNKQCQQGLASNTKLWRASTIHRRAAENILLSRCCDHWLDFLRECVYFAHFCSFFVNSVFYSDFQNKYWKKKKYWKPTTTSRCVLVWSLIWNVAFLRLFAMMTSWHVS